MSPIPSPTWIRTAGKLVAMAAKLGKETRPDIHLGIAASTAAIPPPWSSATRLA